MRRPPRLKVSIRRRASGLGGHRPAAQLHALQPSTFRLSLRPKDVVAERAACHLFNTLPVRPCGNLLGVRDGPTAGVAFGAAGSTLNVRYSREVARVSKLGS